MVTTRAAARTRTTEIAARYVTTAWTLNKRVETLFAAILCSQPVNNMILK